MKNEKKSDKNPKIRIRYENGESRYVDESITKLVKEYIENERKTIEVMDMESLNRISEGMWNIVMSEMEKKNE